MIEARALNKTYKEVIASRDVSFEVPAGEVVGLLGPNGAGKTTVLRMIAGILTPTSGSAWVGGFDSQEQSLEVKRRLGFLSGDTALYQRLTIREVLRYFGELHDMDRQNVDSRAEHLEAELRMDGLLDKRCATLSDGERQKANLARAFLHDPPALILDEPTSSLDVITGRFVLDAIRQEAQKGKSILFSTHQMGEAELVCDRVLLLYQGRIIESGTVDEVCRRAGVRGLSEAFIRRVESGREAAC